MNKFINKKTLIIGAFIIVIVLGGIWLMKKPKSSNYKDLLNGYSITNPDVKNSQTLQQNYQKSYDVSKQVLLKTPDQMDAWVNIGSIDMSVGDYAAAEKVYLHLNEIQPGNSISFGNLGIIYTNYIPNYPKAEEMFKQQLKNKPEDSSAWRNFYELYKYHYAAKNTLAIPTLEDAVKAAPDDYSLWALLAEEYTTEGNKSGAIAAWQKFLSFQPDNQQAKDAIKQLQAK